MKHILKNLVAVLLVISMVTGLIPAEVLGLRLAAARAEAAQQQAIAEAAQEVTAAVNAQFDALAALAAQRTEAAQTDGEWQYVLLEEYNYAVIIGHSDQGDAQIDIPDTLGGADVVALSGAVFSGHDGLYSVSMAGNVYHADGESIPRGVTVRGYNGSYAQTWAQENCHAFENLSQLDFLEGVVDCSGVVPGRFVRHSAQSVTLRELEARRLDEGSIFFLADPNNLYAVSFYRVLSISEAADGFVSITCETPEVKHVLRSFQFENQEMVADWSTMQLYDGVEAEVLTPVDRAGSSAEYECGFSFTPKIKLGSGASVTFSTKYQVKSKMSADYANLKLNSFKMVTEESIAITGKLSYKTALLNETLSPEETSLDARLEQMIRMAESFGGTVDEVVKVNQPLCVVTMFSLWGIFNVTMEAGFNVEFAGSLEVGYTSKTKTTYHYVDGEMKSSSKKLEEGTTFSANAEAKVGVTVSFNMLLFVVEVAQMELFLGLKGTAVYTRTYNSYDPESRAYWADTSLAAHNQAVLDGKLSLAYLNMTDCIEIDVSLLAEVSIKLGNDYVSFAEATITLLEIPLMDWHYHFSPTKYSLDSGELELVTKKFGDWLHDAPECPLKDQVSLMVPELDKSEPMGSYTLGGKSQIPEAPELELPDYGVRVSEWFQDEKLQRPVPEWPYTAASGSFLYGKTEDITVADLINFDGTPLQNTDGKFVSVCLAENETVNTADLQLADQDHIAGWVQVKSDEDRTFVGDIVWADSITLAGGENSVWMALVDNDISLSFRDSENNLLSSITAGHYIEIPESDAPAFPVLYDPAYAVATYEWRDIHGKAYEFPLVPDETVPDIFTLYMVPTGIERVFEADDDPSVITGGEADESGLTTYSSQDYFTYTNYGDYVRIDGFKANQSYQDENGERVEWTAVPERLVIPAYINDLPVQEIRYSAFAELETLVSVTLPSTVEMIGNSAFSSCVNLKKLDLSACSQLTELPYRMAAGCTNLTELSLPGGLLSIGTSAFRDCTSLTSAVVNAAIGDYAFAGCTGLASVELRYGVSSIGEYAFQNCAELTSLIVPCSAKTVGNNFIKGCTGITSLTLDGAPAKVTADTLYIDDENSSLQTLTLCLGVTEIGANAFSDHSQLASITLPEALRSVGSGALKGTVVEYLKVYDLGMLGTGFARNCSTLREIEFEKGIISAHAFADCANLEKITMGDLVFAIGESAFENCTSLTEISFGTGVEILGAYAFAGCSNLQSVTMGEGLLTIGDGAFDDCTSLTEISFPSTVESVGIRMLSGCSALKKITIGGPALPVITNGQIFGMLPDSVLETVVIREGVTTIGYRAFANINEYGTEYAHDNLTTVVLPSTLTTIEKEAFESAKLLTDVTLPSSLKTIGEEAFNGCKALTLNCPDDLELESLGDAAFKGCTSLSSINLGHTLTEIPSYLFQDCESLEELILPESVSTIGEKILRGCRSLKKITLGGPALPVITSGQIFGMLPDSVLETVVIREGVTTIGYRAFANINEFGTEYAHDNLTTVVLPSTLTTIETEAFESAKQLTDLTLPSELKTIGMEAFNGCKALTLNCPDDLELESIGDAAFKDCTSLSSINLGHTLTEIPNYLFQDCESLEELILPESVSTIGLRIVAGCISLKKITLGGPSLPVISSGQIFGMILDSVLETVVIREGVDTIGSRAFANINEYGTEYAHRNLRTVVLPSTLTTIEAEAFESAKLLTDVTFPLSLKTIGKEAFNGCKALTLKCPEDMELESIGDGAFGNCTSLTSINLGHSLQTVGSEAFLNCTSLTALYFPPSVTSYGTKIVGSADALRVLRIGGWGTPELTDPQLLGRQNTEVLETIIIGEGVESIGRRVFANVNNYGTVYGFQRLRNLSLPSTLTSLGSEVFHSSSALTAVNLPDGLVSISDDAFKSCPNLTAVRSYHHSSVIAGYAEVNGYAYTCDRGELAMVQLTLMNGEETLHTLSVQAGETMEAILAAHQPAADEGFTFNGWYMDAECTLAWQTYDVPAFDLILYAGFVPSHTATFTALCDGAAVSESVFSVGEGHLIPWPDEPGAAGLLFEGWYQDEAFTLPFSAAQLMGTEDVNIYGKMTAVSGSAVYAAVESGMELVSYDPGENTECWIPGTVNGRKVVSIAQDAFANAASITNLHLPDHLAHVDAQTLNALENLQWITTGPNSLHYTAVNGILYTRDMTSLVCFPRSKPATSYTALAGVASVEPYACANARWLQSVTLHEGVKTLGDYAFSGCGLLTFRAWGLETIGVEALPVWNAGMRVYGPVKTGVLRDSLILSTENGYTTFKAPYNLYGVSLYVNNGLVNTIGLEAGSVLPADFVYGEMEDGTVIHTWFTDKDLTTAWDPAAVTPEQDISLYTSATPIISYQNAVFTVDGEEINGLLLTAYNGMGGALVLPSSIGGATVMGIGEAFLANCQGTVTSVQIPSSVIQIADTALVGPEEFPFGGTVKADEGSYAAEWAVRMGYTTANGVYTLAFQTNGGSSVASRTVACLSSVRLPEPVKTGCTFAGWYTDEALSTAAELVDGCFVMPGADTTLYAAWEGTAQVWPFTWEENAGEITITAYTGNDSELILPETINGMNVTVIADSAFEGNQSIVTLVLPAAMRTIGSAAFSGTTIASVDLGGTSIVEADAFANCEQLSSLIAENLTTLGDRAFAGCTSLASFHVPETLTDISHSAFDGCTSLAAFTAAESNPLFSVQEGMLLQSGVLLLRYPQGHPDATCTLPDGVSIIGEGAFRDALYLNEVILPDDLMGIGESAFAGCTGLTELVLTESMTVSSIPAGVFENCTSLSSVTLSSHVTSIGENAFMGCTALREITIPETVVDIAPAAFGSSSALTIYGVYGSAACLYALENGIPFVDPNAAEVTAITIDCNTDLIVGETTALTAVLTPADAVIYGSIVWTSSDPSVLSIYNNMAYAMGAGTATVTAVAPNGVSASADFLVTSAPDLRLSASAITLVPGQRVRAEVLGAAENVQFIWTSSNETVAILQDGMITAVAPGQATVTCSAFAETVLEITVVESLPTITLPAQLKTVSDEAFAASAAGCIQVQDGLLSIGQRAFADMPGLAQLILPVSVTDIAADALIGCSSAVIFCREDSAAHQFASTNDLAYVLVEDE